MVSHCDRWMSVDHPVSCVVHLPSSTTASNDISSLPTGWILTKLVWPFSKIVQMVPVHRISRSHSLKIYFQDGKFENLLP